MGLIIKNHLAFKKTLIILETLIVLIIKTVYNNNKTMFKKISFF